MAASAEGIRWTVPPGVLADGANDYKARVHGALAELGQYYAAKIEGEMKANAPWTDRTNQARNGLTGEYIRRGNSHIIALYGTATHTIYLELRWSGRWAIIRPTMNRMAPEVFKAAEELLA